MVAPAPLPGGYSWPWHVLRFIDWLEDADPTKLAWTKINVSISSLCTGFTTVFTTIQTVLVTVGHTDWHVIAGGSVGTALSVAWHKIASDKHEAKRSTEAK